LKRARRNREIARGVDRPAGPSGDRESNSMSRLTNAAAAALAGAALAACGPQGTTSTETAPAPTAEAPPVAPAVTPSQTQAFANQAAQTDMLEIQIGKIAQTKSSDADVKSLAKMLIDDHTKTTQQLKDWAAANPGMSLPVAIDADTQAQIDHIANTDAATFNDTFLDAVVDGHEKAISAFKDYAESGDNAALKAWAAKTVPTLQTHLQKAQSVRDKINKKGA
jgi:putative membrane protein